MENLKLFKCKYCGKEYMNKSSLGVHTFNCKLSPNYRSKTLPVKEYTIICPVCGNVHIEKMRESVYLSGKYKKCCSKQCSAKLTFLNSNKDEKNKNIASSLKTFHLNSLNKEEQCFKRINAYYCSPKYCLQCGSVIDYEKRNRKYCSDTCKNIALKKILSEKGKIAYNNRKDKPFERKNLKTGWYKGIPCDSGWELIFLIYNLDHGKNVKRCNKTLYYVFNNETFRYYPDFEIDGVIYEIKGFENEKAKAKKEQHPEVVYLYKKDLKHMFKYVISTYGKEYWNLYDKLQ